MDQADPAATPKKRRTPWNTLSARVIALVSRKGGVGKTTSAVNLGAAFALSGHTVLVIGVDPQCGVAPTLGCGPGDLSGGLVDLFERDLPLTHLAHTSPLKDLFFASSRVRDLAEEERFLGLMNERPDTFVQEVDRARNLYDTIIIDCPPNLGAPTRAALRAADSVLVPVQAEELCRDSLGALLGALDTFNEARGGEVLEEGPELEGIFLTMLNERTRMGRHVAARVAEEFGPVLLETSVPRTTRLSEMALRGKPSVIYDRRSAGSRAYFNLADEIMTRYRVREGLEPAAAPEREDDPDGQPRSTARTATAGDLTATASGPTGPGYRLAENLEALLGDLRAAGSLELPSAPGAGDFASPEMVSLDELLAEEESAAADPWDEALREQERRRGRLN
jgi:chromosome partitioning protein